MKEVKICAAIPQKDNIAFLAILTILNLALEAKGVKISLENVIFYDSIAEVLHKPYECDINTEELGTYLPLLFIDEYSRSIHANIARAKPHSFLKKRLEHAYVVHLLDVFILKIQKLLPELEQASFDKVKAMNLDKYRMEQMKYFTLQFVNKYCQDSFGLSIIVEECNRLTFGEGAFEYYEDGLLKIFKHQGIDSTVSSLTQRYK